MKTKTVLLIVLFSIGINATSFAQKPSGTVSSPTLTETLNWIKSYLGANGDKLLIKGDDGVRYLETMTLDPSTKILLFADSHTSVDDMYLSVSIDLSKCTSIKKGYLASGSSDFVKYKITNEKGYKSEYDFNSTAILLKLTENGDYAKLDKALKHLCELCGIKLMNEDLF